MKTEKMNSDRAIDFLFDQTGKLRTTRVRHQAIVDALSVVKSELRDIRNDAINESKAVQSSMCANIKLVNENDELRIKLKREEDRAAAFAGRNIDLSNEIEKLKHSYRSVDFQSSCVHKKNNILRNDNVKLRSDLEAFKKELEELKNRPKTNVEKLVDILNGKKVKPSKPDYVKNSIL